MAELPPRVPSLSSCPSFHHHNKYSSTGNLSPPQNPSWVDEFLDFSANRRGTHRRSMSDSITFLESPLTNADELERFDDEQFMSMFADETSATIAGRACSNPSTPSDQNSISEEIPGIKAIALKSEPEEVESERSSDQQDVPESVADRTVDPKRVKRILANRQSAQRSRVRKLQYISDLERSVTSLQTEVSLLSPRVAFLDHQRRLLNVDNSALKQRIAALAQDKIFKDAHQEALKAEIERLRRMHHQQSVKNEHDRSNSLHNEKILNAS